MENRSYLPSLQLFRAIAALMVVFHHLWHEISLRLSIHNTILDLIAACGKSGVDFFFVLSGFIICYAHSSKMGNKAAAGAYLKGRLLRIYLPYLPITIVLLLAYRFLPSLSYVHHYNYSWLKSLTLLPIFGDTVLSVAWTLVFEMFFYLVFLLAFVSRTLFFSALGVWAIAIALFAVPAAWMDVGLPKFLFSTFHLEFMLGVCAAVVIRRVSAARVKWVAAALLIPIVLLYLLPVVLDNKILLGLSFALVVLVAVHSPVNKASGRNLLMVLGNASYSIYLVHVPAISLLIRVLPVHHAPLYVAMATGCSIIVLCFGGVLYSRVFERGLLRWVKDRRLYVPYPAQWKNAP